MIAHDAVTAVAAAELTTKEEAAALLYIPLRASGQRTGVWRHSFLISQL